MIRAVLFDAMGTLFDLEPLRARLSSLGAPPPALEAWFERLLHTAASLTLIGEFRPFEELARATLATTLAQLDLEPGRADEVLEALGELPAYPDAAPALDRLGEAGLPAVVLTNGGREETRALLESAGLLGRVREVVTAADAGAYKPAPAPYRHAVERLGLTPDRATLIAAHGWDVLGARAAGLDAVWVERLERRWPFPFPEPARARDLEQAAALVVAAARG